jgi:hypothetical protein
MQWNRQQLLREEPERAATEQTYLAQLDDAVLTSVDVLY